MTTLAINIIGAVVTAGLFLFVGIASGIIGALIFGIVAIRAERMT